MMSKARERAEEWLSYYKDAMMPHQIPTTAYHIIRDLLDENKQLEAINRDLTARIYEYEKRGGSGVDDLK